MFEKIRASFTSLAVKLKLKTNGEDKVGALSKRIKLGFPIIRAEGRIIDYLPRDVREIINEIAAQLLEEKVNLANSGVVEVSIHEYKMVEGARQSQKGSYSLGELQMETERGCTSFKISFLSFKVAGKTINFKVPIEFDWAVFDY